MLLLTSSLATRRIRLGCSRGVVLSLLGSMLVLAGCSASSEEEGNLQGAIAGASEPGNMQPVDSESFSQPNTGGEEPAGPELAEPTPEMGDEEAVVEPPEAVVEPPEAVVEPPEAVVEPPEAVVEPPEETVPVVDPEPADGEMGEETPPEVPAPQNPLFACSSNEPAIRDGRDTLLLQSADGQTCVRLERVETPSGTSKGPIIQLLRLVVGHQDELYDATPDNTSVFAANSGQHGVGGFARAVMPDVTLMVTSMAHWLTNPHDTTWDVTLEGAELLKGPFLVAPGR